MEQHAAKPGQNRSNGHRWRQWSTGPYHIDVQGTTGQNISTRRQPQTPGFLGEEEEDDEEDMHDEEGQGVTVIGEESEYESLVL